MRKIGTAAVMMAVLGAMPSAAIAQSDEAQYEKLIADTKASMMSNPQKALNSASAAEKYAKQMDGQKAKLAHATIGWLSGEALTRLDQPSQAMPKIDAALTIVKDVAPGSKLHGDLLKAYASTESKSGQLQKALPKLHQAYAIYQKLGETRAQAIILQNLGSVYYDARDYERMLQYSAQSAMVHSSDNALSVALHTNRGNAFKELGRFDEADVEYDKAMQLAIAMKSDFLQATILSNRAASQMANGQFEKARQTALRGLVVSKGGAAEWQPSFYGVLGQISFKRGQLSEADGFFKKAFADVDLTKSTTTFQDFHETAYQLYRVLGQHDVALQHLEAFKRLDDSGREVAASTNGALLSARFDAANQQVRISKLESQQAQREIALQKSQNRVRNFSFILAFGGIAAILVIGGLGFGIHASRQRRREISEANVRLTYAANHDLLTGLANRSYFKDLTEQGIAEAEESGGRCAIMLIDLDRFKWVNDTLGHAAGDTLLCTVAECLLEMAGDSGYPVRLGGDEFALVIPNAGSDEELAMFAARIIDRLSEPHSIEGSTANIGATIGIAIGPDDGADMKTLARRADLALYAGKDAGRGCAVRFTADMQKEIDERQTLEHDLRYALERDQLKMAYQAIVDAATEEVIGYEALVRWDHPEHGAISPAKFIPIAEESGIINRIGDWVLRTACEEASTWPEHMTLAVNLSAIQVAGQALTSHVMNALAASGIDPHRLELEVTESVFMSQSGAAEETLSQLRMMGVRLALDDFGTGFSSLGYLRRATFTTIKIDRSFVKAASQNSHEGIAIIRSIVSLANAMGMHTTAEGVETREQLEQMREFGCSQIQGYLFSRPVASPLATPVEVKEEAVPENAAAGRKRAA